MVSVHNHAAQSIRSGSPIGFTLVELLVVIGIIALLISILLPTLGRARKQAQTVACASNMRQLGVALRMYADANGGYLPYSMDFGTTYKGRPYAALPLQRSIAMGMGLKPNAAGSYPNSPALLCGAAEPRGTRHFSAHPRLMPDFAQLNGTAMAGSVDGSYRYAKIRRSTDVMLLFEGSQQVFDEGWNTFGNTDSSAYNLDSSRMFWDGTAFLRQPGEDLSTKVTTNNINRDSTSGGDGARGNVRWRHGNNDTANFLFVDGHIESMKAKRTSSTVVTNGGDFKRGNLLIDQ